jgi:two-component system, OmpR family, KDP operon response regulator KdpE
MKILVIDDDLDYGEILGLYLQSQGFTPLIAKSGEEGLSLVKHHDPHLVILDVSMPYMDGWETVERLRSFSNIPIIMISAVAKEEDDAIRALNNGADDYLTKPINPTLLNAYIHALLRRASDVSRKKNRPIYIDAHLKIDLFRQEVLVANKVISLSFLEYRLLEILVENANDVLSTLEIAETLWGETESERYGDYVRIYVGRLRRQIEPNASDPIYILNVHGLGYRFVAQV